MASTVVGDRLTERHRRSQVALRSLFLARFVPLWPLLAWNRLDDTTPGWVQAVMRLLRPFRQDSADLAVRYYGDYRRVEASRAAGPAPEIEFARPAETLGRAYHLGTRTRSGFALSASTDSPVRRDELARPRIDWSEWDKAAERSLLVTGPVELKRQAARGVGEDPARRVALVRTSGAAARHVLSGGRHSILTLVHSDEQALGWARVGDADPCAWCAMLISRGPVYTSRETALFPAHDLCACVAAPSFTRSEPLSEQARELQRLWRASTKGHSGQDAVRAFRRTYERQRRDAVADPLTA